MRSRQRFRSVAHIFTLLVLAAAFLLGSKMGVIASKQAAKNAKKIHRPRGAVAPQNVLKKLLRQKAIPAPHYMLEEQPRPLPSKNQRQKAHSSARTANQSSLALSNGESQPGYDLPFPLEQPHSVLGPIGVPSGVRRFILLTTQRSGSGWLLHKLASRFPHVRADPSEPFIGPKHALQDAEYNAMGEQNFRYFLDRTLLRRCGMNGWQPREVACGFKFMYNQMPAGVSDAALLQWAKDNDVVFIHLVRQNILRNLISKALLTRDQDEHQGNAHVRKNDPQLSPKTIAAVIGEVASEGNISVPEGTALIYNNSRQIRLPYPRNETWDDDEAVAKFANRVRFDLKDISHWRRLLLQFVPSVFPRVPKNEGMTWPCL
eukprot:INCI2713.2.p1 GENE.INCI2713.2~~INCI2713.2.p1  ORF type:complete len:374 (+),score=40.59 INCI2713.2:534-1655(+)